MKKFGALAAVVASLAIPTAAQAQTGIQAETTAVNWIAAYHCPYVCNRVYSSSQQGPYANAAGQTQWANYGWLVTNGISHYYQVNTDCYGNVVYYRIW